MGGRLLKLSTTWAISAHRGFSEASPSVPVAARRTNSIRVASISNTWQRLRLIGSPMSSDRKGPHLRLTTVWQKAGGHFLCISSVFEPKDKQIP